MTSNPSAATVGEDRANYEALKLWCSSWKGAPYRLQVELSRPLFLTMKGARHLLQRVQASIRILESSNRKRRRGGRPKTSKGAS